MSFSTGSEFQATDASDARSSALTGVKGSEKWSDVQQLETRFNGLTTGEFDGDQKQKKKSHCVHQMFVWQDLSGVT